LAHCEDGRLRVPASLLPEWSQELQIPVEALLKRSSSPKVPPKRGPAPKPLQHLERISALPTSRQRAVIAAVEVILVQQGR